MGTVCVFGSYKEPGRKERENIVKLGKLLAEKGFDVVSGGFGGTMKNVSKGAKSAGGKTIGVTYYKEDDWPYKKPNEYIAEEIKTKNIFERISVMMKKSDAFVIFPGGTGTLLELAACLEHINKGLMKPKPIIAIGTFWKNAVETLAGEAVLNSEARSALDAISCRDLVLFVDTIEEAAARISSAV